MNVNKALIIAYYFPPMGLSGVQRTMKFVKYLPDFDWNPIVLAANPSSYYAYDDTLLTELDREEIEIHYTNKKGGSGKKQKKFPSYFKQKLGKAVLQSLRQPDSKKTWMKEALELGRKILKRQRINAIFATAPPFTDFLVAGQLAKEFGLPYIVDYRDIWVDNPFNFYLTPFHKNHSIRLEEGILTHSERAIVTTRFAKELLLKRYSILSHNDIKIIPQGYDPSDFNVDIIEKNPEKFVITHTGLFQDDRTPKYFLKALESLLDSDKEARDKIEIRFVGLMRTSHLKMFKKYKYNDNIKTTGYVNHKSAVKQLLESDVLWLMLNDKFRSPGKIYEYFGAGKPLLVTAPEGAMRSTAEQSGAAICCDPDDIKGIKLSLIELFEKWKNNNLPEYKDNFREKFDRKTLTGDLARELALIAEI